MHHTDKETKTKCWFGWISPDGQTFPCDYHGHFDLAKKLAGTLGVHDDRPMRNPELLLEQHGWVKVTDLQPIRPRNIKNEKIEKSKTRG